MCEHSREKVMQIMAAALPDEGVYFDEVYAR